MATGCVTPGDDREVHRLHVGGLPADVDEQELKRRFQPFGYVVAAEVIRATDSGESRGFGYVSLQASEAEVERSIKAYTGTRWRGQRLTVWYARESYLDRLQREWEEARSEREVAAAPTEDVVAWDRTAPLRVRPSRLAPVITAKPGQTNRHKRKFGTPASLPAKSDLFTAYTDEPNLVSSTAAHRLGVKAGEGASESGDDAMRDEAGWGASSDGEAAEEMDAEGERQRVDSKFVLEGKHASAEQAAAAQPEAPKKGTSPIPAAVPGGLEDELAEAELFMRGKAKVMDALKRPVLKKARTGAILAGSSVRPSRDAKASAGSGRGGSSGISEDEAESAGAGKHPDGSVGGACDHDAAHLKLDTARAADAAEAEAEAERERERSASLRVLSELLGQDVGESERHDGRGSRAADRKRRWGEWASPDGWQMGAKFDPEAEQVGAKFNSEAKPVGARFDPEADKPAAKFACSPTTSAVGSPVGQSTRVGQEADRNLTESSPELPPAPRRARAHAVGVVGAASDDAPRATAAVKKAAVKATLKSRPLSKPPTRDGPPEPTPKLAGDISAAPREVPGPAEAVSKPRAASLRKTDTPASEAPAKARRIDTQQSSKAESSCCKAAPAVEPKAAVQSAVRLRGLFVGGGSGDSFALSELLGDAAAEARSTTATGGATPQGPSTSTVDTSEPGLLFQSPFESARAGARGSETRGEAVPIAEAGGLPVAAETAWAAPQVPFMRQESEAELLRSWRRGRSEARHAYKKTHQDAVRQRRKDRAAFKKPGAGRTA
jgi:hypothetical protein